MQTHHKCETAGKVNKCDADFLKTCSDYYHKGGGKERQRAWLARRTPEQIERKRAKAREWKLRNKPRKTLLLWATTTKDRVRKKNPAVAGVAHWDLIGCNVVELQSYIEGLFRDGIGWHNRDEWEIDHIRPLCSFDLSDMAQVRECLHFSNVQVLITGPHWEKARQESADYMRRLAENHWAERGDGEYPGFTKAWNAFTKWRQAHKLFKYARPAQG